MSVASTIRTNFSPALEDARGADCRTPGRCKAEPQQCSSELIAKELPHWTGLVRAFRDYFCNLRFSTDENLVCEKVLKVVSIALQKDVF